MKQHDLNEILVTSTLDGTSQPSLLFIPSGAPCSVPLVIGLHTWSYDRFNKVDDYLPLCRARGWALLLPDFRGPNLRTNPQAAQACVADTAIQDIIDATDHVLGLHPQLAPDRLFLLGASGGGLAALMVAARPPRRWAAVDTWCPVSDLLAWHRHYGNGVSYAAELEHCIGGTPDTIPDEYRRRSPVTYAAALAQTTLSIRQGRHDDIVPWQLNRDTYRAIEAFSPSALYFDLFDGVHDEHPHRSFEWFDALLGQRDATTITG